MNDTCSTIFLLHQLEIERTALKEMGFVNAYMRDANRSDENKLLLYLLFKPNDLGMFNFHFELEKERTPNLIEDYDYEGGYVVLVYQLPVRFKEDYLKYERGEYSKFSKEFKKVYKENILAYDIINKTDNMKKYWTDKLGYDFYKDPKMEVWSLPDIEKETLDITKILQNA